MIFVSMVAIFFVCSIWGMALPFFPVSRHEALHFKLDKYLSQFSRIFKNSENSEEKLFG